MEKIDKQQLNRLLTILEKYGLKNKWILEICNIESLIDMTVKQYNFLLILILQVGI